MLKAIIDYFIGNDESSQSKKESATKIITAAIAILTVALGLAEQISNALK